MFQGSLVALVTPMRDDGAVDEQALSRLIEFHIDSGTNGIVSVGTTGESATLDVDEHMAVIRKTIEVVAGRIPVIAGTGANATREAIELTRLAQAAGADACLLVTPYYNKPSQEGLYQHFRAVAEAVDIPQIVYNVPGRTALDMLPETTLRLAEVENIIGIKEALGEVSRIQQLVAMCPADFSVFTGDDATAMESMLAGAKGDISVTANVVPAQMQRMCAAAVAGQREAAEAVEAEIQDLHRVLFLESNPIPVKWAMARIGLIGGALRLPMTPLAAQHHAVVEAALEKAGALGND